MSAPYEPFTPANGSDRYRAEGRRRTSWDDESSWPAQDPWSSPDQYAQQDQYVQQDQYAQQQQWPQQQEQWSYQQQPQQQYHYQHQYQQQPERQWAPAPAPQRAPAESPSRSRPGRGRVVVIGLVVALLVVSGWQAFRVEGMIQASTDLANAVSADQGRSAELEKKLTTVFDPEGISSAVLPSVFRVRAGDFTGTAFAVGKTDDGETHLFTNYHVIEETFTGGDKTVALERGNTRIDATIIKVNERRDLALLRAEREINGLGLAPGEVKPGQQVVVVGAPLGLDDSVAAGVISAYRPDDAAGPTIQFDAPINPGNSGGPVVNASKQVVGIATAKARDAEGIGLAIPIQTACETLEVCGNN